MLQKSWIRGVPVETAVRGQFGAHNVRIVVEIDAGIDEPRQGTTPDG